MEVQPSFTLSPVAAKILLETRKAKSMTLKELSTKTEISEGYLSLLERRHRPMSRQNFVKIFEVGFGYSEESASNLWQQITENEDDQESVAAKTLASSKYRVRNMGFGTSGDDGGTYRWVGCRWTIIGRIYSWKFFENSTNSIFQKNPLTGEEAKTTWQEIFNLLKRDETQGLLEAIYSEFIKTEEDANHYSEKDLFKYAVMEIEDIRDALDSMPENNYFNLQSH